MSKKIGVFAIVVGRQSLVAILILLTVLVACSDVIDLNVDPEQRIVIYGRITDGLAGNEVNIALTSPYNGRQDPVTGGCVSLIEDGAVIASYEELGNGLYRLNYADSAKEGRTYQVSVELPDGRNYQSEPAIMPGLAAVDNLEHRASLEEIVVTQSGLVEKKNIVRLYTNTRVVDQNKDFYLRWNIREAYTIQERIRNTPIPPPPCYATNDITGQEVLLFDGATLKFEVIPDLLLSSTEVDSRFAFAYFYTVIQFTMDEQAHDYWTKINEVSNLPGSIFDRPVAAVPGNLRNVNDPEEEVLGYFEVVRSDTSFMRLRSDDLSILIHPPCPHSEAHREPPFCTACLLYPNSSHHRPYYWY